MYAGYLELRLSLEIKLSSCQAIYTLEETVGKQRGNDDYVVHDNCCTLSGIRIIKNDKKLTVWLKFAWHSFV